MKNMDRTKAIFFPSNLKTTGSSITSAAKPVTTAVADEHYQYRVHATDPDADPLTFDLVDRPEGMVIDGQTGLIAWNPNYTHVGTQSVIVRVRDPYGGSDLQAFEIDCIT